MVITICVAVSSDLRRLVFVESGSMPDGVWTIDIDTGDLDREERRHLLRMSKWSGDIRLHPTSPGRSEIDVRADDRIHVKAYTAVASPRDPRIRGVEFEIDVDPKNELERVVVDAYLAAMGVGVREDAPSPIDAARALVRLDAQSQEEAFRQFRREMVDYVRAVIEEDRLDDRMLHEFLCEAIRQWNDIS